MKGAGKIILVVGFISLSLLFYVHGQVSLFRISYDLQEREDTMAEKAEEYRLLKFEVDQLKAPRLLEARIKEHDFNLTLPKEIRVIRIPPSRPAPATPIPQVSKGSPAEGFQQVLGRLVGIAQAKTES